MFSCHLMVKVVHKFAATEARVKKVDLSCSLFTTQFALMSLFLLVATKKNWQCKKGSFLGALSFVLSFTRIKGEWPHRKLLQWRP